MALQQSTALTQTMALQAFARKPTLSVLPQVLLPLEKYVVSVLLHADCNDSTVVNSLEQALLELGHGIVPALFTVIEQGNVPQQALSIQLLLRFGAPIRHRVLQFCNASQASPKTSMALSFLKHHLGTAA